MEDSKLNERIIAVDSLSISSLKEEFGITLKEKSAAVPILDSLEGYEFISFYKLKAPDTFALEFSDMIYREGLQILEVKNMHISEGFSYLSSVYIAEWAPAKCIYRPSFGIRLHSITKPTKDFILSTTCGQINIYTEQGKQEKKFYGSSEELIRIKQNIFTN